MPRMRVSVHKDWSFDSFRVRVAQENDRGEFSVMQEATFAPLPRGHFAPESFSLDDQGAQEIMNELWRLGVRPTDATGSTGHLRAVENHNKDLKEIVDKFFVELSHRG
jgi:hypothetical protein